MVLVHATSSELNLQLYEVVHDTSSECALQVYDVSLKYLKRLSCYRADTK